MYIDRIKKKLTNHLLQDPFQRLAGTASMERHLTGVGSRDLKSGGPVNTWSAGRRLHIRGPGSGSPGLSTGNDSLFVGSVERKGRRSRPSPAYRYNLLK